MPQLQLNEASSIGNASAAVAFDTLWHGTPTTGSGPEVPLIPGWSPRGRPSRSLGDTTVDFQISDELDPLGSETTSVSEDPPRRRRISLGQARKIALNAMATAEERWQRAVDAESEFFDTVLDGLDGDR